MPIDLKTAIALGTRRYLAPTVVVLLLLSGGMIYVWSEYKELVKEINQIAVERKSFNDEIVLSEQARAAASMALIERKAELDKREFVLQQLEGQTKEKQAKLQQLESEYDTAFVKLQQAQVAVSQTQRQNDVEDKIQILMSQFSAMGVDFNDPLQCGDAEGQARFNAAKAKYSEIYTLAEAYGLTKRYKNFFTHNSQNRWSACQK